MSSGSGLWRRAEPMAAEIAAGWAYLKATLNECPRELGWWGEGDYTRSREEISPPPAARSSLLASGKRSGGTCKLVGEPLRPTPYYIVLIVTERSFWVGFLARLRDPPGGGV